MTVDWFLTYREVPELVQSWLAGLGVRAPERGARDLANLVALAGPGRIETVARIAVQLDASLAHCPDPEMSLSNFERFIAAFPPEGRARALAELAADARMTEALLRLFSTSQHFSELLARSPQWFDWLRRDARPRERDTLIEELWNELAPLSSIDDQKRALRTFRQREGLGIGHRDVVEGAPLEETAGDLSNLADACIEGATRLARARLEARYGVPRTASGAPARFVVLALGKLGGAELNYSSDIDLMFLHDEEGRTAGPRSIACSEFFERVAGAIVQLLADPSTMGAAYRVDARLRPDGAVGAMSRTLAGTLNYYEERGQTWERQALIKCRPVAGDHALGQSFQRAIDGWIYRARLSAAEIAEIKAVKRRIERRAADLGTETIDVKTGRGGIRDIEFVVQFLQLLHGGERPEVRGGNTLSTIAALERAGCLRLEERAALDDGYRFLRRVEHRLQIVFDRQTHAMPRDAGALRTLALRMGHAPLSPWEARGGPALRFLDDYRNKTERDRRILDHLLHNAFQGGDGADADPVVDLVLGPGGPVERDAAPLARYGFRDPETALDNLLALARESSPFLSHARCRHFLAAIAPRLLEAIARAPGPDLALTNLEKVSASLGAKAMLWELFQLHPPSLRLYVELCATSPFLSGIMIENPGMIDDLIDSLVLDSPSSTSAIEEELAGLCANAEDLAPILSGFRNKEWLRIGARDVLAREPVRVVTRELADVAAAIVGQLARDQWRRKAERHGVPHDRSGTRPDRWAVLALGKLGGGELTYHGDLDLVLLHEHEGATIGGPPPIANDQFINAVARSVLKALADGAATGPLYSVDLRLRPHGASGPLVATLDAFRAYLESSVSPWEKLALTRARVVFDTGGFGRDVAATLREHLGAPTDPASLAEHVRAMRGRLEAARPARDFKRGPGGIVDIEFLVQYLQLVHAHERPDVLQPNLWDALDALKRHGVLDHGAHAELRDAYDFLRAIEGRSRLVQNRSADVLPDSAEDLERLARQFPGAPGDTSLSPAAFLEKYEHVTRRNRELFFKHVD